MVYQKDYLMRLIEQFIQGLLQVLFHIEAGELVVAEDHLETLYNKSLGLSRESVSMMSDDQLLLLFGGEDAIGSDKCVMLAELFYAEVKLLPDSIPEEQYRDQAMRSLSFYLRAMESTNLWDGTDFQEHFENLLGTLPFSSIPGDKLRSLANYYQRTGNLDQHHLVLKQVSF